MANISLELQQIMNAVYGEEVRGSIHNAIDKINKVGEKVLNVGTDISKDDPAGSSYDSSLYINTQTFDLLRCNGTIWVKVAKINGNGITEITGPVSSGDVDTYTIHYDNGDTRTYQLTNGRIIETYEATNDTFDSVVENASDGDFIYNIEQEGGAAAGAKYISELLDVNTVNKQNGYTLRYNSVTGKWEAANIGSGDMLKSVYDQNEDNIVDEASTLTGLTATVTELNTLDGIDTSISLADQLDDKVSSTEFGQLGVRVGALEANALTASEVTFLRLLMTKNLVDAQNSSGTLTLTSITTGE